MSNRIVFLLLLLFCSLNNVSADSVIQMDNTHIFFRSSSLCLQFVLNTETKEAMLGNGIDRDHNALFDPRNPYAPYNPDEPGPNWYSIDVPETISFDGDTYTVTSVAPNAFYKSTEVNYITLPNTIRSIGGSAFGYCTYLKEVNIPEGVEGIEQYTFYICKKMKEIHLPSTIKSIGYYAFGDCQALETISIPSGCTTISDEAFTLCLGLKNLTFEDGDEPLVLGYAFDKGIEPVLDTYEFRGLFSDCPLQNIYIGREIQIETEKVREYSPFEGVFQRGDGNGHYTSQHGWKSIDKVEFGDNVKKICGHLFRNLSIHSEIILPKNVEVIGEYAFYKTLSQNTLVIPESCISIEKRAFAALNSGGTIRTIECQSNIPPSVTMDAFQDCVGFMVAVPAGAREAYSKDEFWGKHFIYDVNDEFVTVDLKYAGSLYGRLAYQDIEPTDVFRLKVTGTMGEDDWTTIAMMSNLYELDLSEVSTESISSISKILSHLRVFKFPNGVKEIGENLFKNSHLTGEIVIPASCEKIGFAAFAYCYDLNKVIIEGPAYIDYRAFLSCKNLSLVSIQGDGAVVAKEAFDVCYDINNSNSDSGLKTIILGAGVTVERWGFSSVKNLQEIIIDGQVKSIENNAFLYSGEDHITPNVIFNGSVDEFMTERLTVA